MDRQSFYKAIQGRYQIEDESTVIKVPFDNIVDLDNEKLVYRSNGGTIESLSFDSCAENFDFIITNQTNTKIVGGRFFAMPV